MKEDFSLLYILLNNNLIINYAKLQKTLIVLKVGL